MSVWKNQKRGTWIAKFWHEKKPYKKEGFKTKSEAREWEVLRKQELQNPLKETRSISFQELATKYLEHCQVRFQKNTWRSKSHYYRTFQNFLNKDIPVEEIKKAVYSEYLNDIAYKKGTKTANRHLKALNALFNWGIQNDHILSNPVKNISKFGEDEYIKYVPPVEDINKVLLIASGEDLDMLNCLYYTGGRIGEILRLTWNDVNFERRCITLWTRKRFGGGLESDILAMPNTLFNTLQKRWNDRNKKSSYVFHNQDDKPWRYDQKKHMMRDLCKRANVKRFGFHAIRHHVASILEDSGKATLGQIQKFLRHKRKTTTENYMHNLTRDLVEVAGILDEKEHKKNGQACGQVKG